MKFFVSLIVLFFSQLLLAQSVKVAFLSERSADGRQIQYEYKGRFSHLAISFESFWLHVDPYWGVTLSDHLHNYGDIEMILTHPQIKEPSLEFVDSVVGLPFNMFAQWDCSDSTYCSKFIGKFFSLKPLPMSFKSPDWQGIENLPRGQLGLSPDDVYQLLLDRGFAPIKKCQAYLGAKRQKMNLSEH